MNYPRLPRNIYSYRASVFGIPLHDALMVSAIVSFSLLGLRLSIFLPLISLSAIPLLIYSKAGHSTGSKHPSIAGPRKKKFSLVFYNKFRFHNGHSFLYTAGHACLFYEISGLNVLALRASTQKSVIERLRSAIEDASIDMDFYSVHETTEEGQSRMMAYRTFVRFSKKAAQPNHEVALDSLIYVGQKFQNSLLSAGMDSKELNAREEIEALVRSLSS